MPKQCIIMHQSGPAEAGYYRPVLLHHLGVDHQVDYIANNTK